MFLKNFFPRNVYNTKVQFKLSANVVKKESTLVFEQWEYKFDSIKSMAHGLGSKILYLTLEWTISDVNILML